MIGTARRRRDGEAKVRGTTRYVGDMPAHGLLHARPVLAAEAHARLLGIDTTAALAVPGVVAVLTHADLPLAGGSGRAAEPLAREEIVWAGQPVALVVAETEAAAEDAAALVDVDTEWLEPVLDLEAALADGAPAARLTERAGEDESAASAHGGSEGQEAARGGDGDDTAGGGEAHGGSEATGGGEAHGGSEATGGGGARGGSEATGGGEAHGDSEATGGGGARGGGEATGGGSPNVATRQRLQRGDVDAGLAAADHVVRGRFRTSWVHQAYLEPQSTLAWVEPDGTLVVHSSTQGAFMVRQGLASTFGLPMEQVRVQAAPLGGAFGGKLMIAEPLVAAAALALRRPVRIVFSRTEEFAAGNPAPGQLIDLELGATRDGALTAIRGRVVGDRGGLGDMGVEALSTLLAAGPYRWPAHDLTAIGVTTNRVSPGAYRAPGAPPAAFAVETLLDELAQALDLDPIALRLKNVLVGGDRGLDGQEIKVIGAHECITRLQKHPLYVKRDELPEDEGVGFALGFWPGGLEPAAAICKLDADGRLTVVTAAADMSGIENAFIAIAAEAFGLPEEHVRVTTGDTGSAPYGGVAGGSKVTYTYGRAVERAAEQARERLLDVAASELEIAPEDLEVADGEVRPVGAPGRAIAIADLAAKVYTFGGQHRPIEGYGSTAQVSRAPGAAAHLSHVRVDRETGEIRLLAHVIAQDVGKALNPALVEGQMHGGTAQGIGWALLEELGHTDEGQLQGATFAEYALPSADQVPEIETLLVEVPAPDGPFGAKGVGEPPVCAVPAAIANAVAAAAGIRPGVLPMTSARVWALLQNAPVVR